jgi:alkylation response protein AidB-like acyl-CoA dehydrogenase
MTKVDADAVTVRKALDELFRDCQPSADPRSFLAAQFDAGLAWVHFPVGRGGLDLPRSLQHEVTVRCRNEGAPSGQAQNPLGYSMGAPTLLAWANDQQLDRYLRPLFTGQERWCQLFSEPGAGSDLAGVATRAVRDGDEWIVTGQKVWNSMAHISDVGMLIARTDPDVPKHQGLTYFAIDMHAPGVEVRPLRQMTGDAEFNEVYLNDVRVPDSCRLGSVGAGWQVSVSTLMNERVMFGSEGRDEAPADLALQLYQARGELAGDPELRARLIQLLIRARVVGFGNARAAAKLATGAAGPEGSISKISFAELNQDGFELCLDLLGDESMLYEDYTMKIPDSWVDRHAGYDARTYFLRSRANSIEGGSTEIMRNILAERVLGLPAERRVDKDRPWSEVPKS